MKTVITIWENFGKAFWGHKDPGTFFESEDDAFALFSPSTLVVSDSEPTPGYLADKANLRSDCKQAVNDYKKAFKDYKEQHEPA